MTAAKLWGKYRGRVVDNHDPLMIGRVRAQVPDAMGPDDSGWAMPCAPFGGADTGLFALPAVGAGVWIEFEHGNPDYPIWTGCWWGDTTEMPAVLLAPPYQKVMVRTAGGHQVVLDDTPGTGGITLETREGQRVQLAATSVEITNGLGASISLTGPQVSINNGALEII